MKKTITTLSLLASFSASAQAPLITNFHLDCANGNTVDMTTIMRPAGDATTYEDSLVMKDHSGNQLINLDTGDSGDSMFNIITLNDKNTTMIYNTMQQTKDNHQIVNFIVYSPMIGDESGSIKINGDVFSCKVTSTHSGS